MLWYLMSKGKIRIESSEERLVEGLERGLRFLEKKKGRSAPRWDVLKFLENIMRLS